MLEGASGPKPRFPVVRVAPRSRYRTGQIFATFPLRARQEGLGWSRQSHMGKESPDGGRLSSRRQSSSERHRSGKPSTETTFVFDLPASNVIEEWSGA